MTHFSIQTIKTWQRFYRANFINCLSGYKSATLIGTYKENGLPNIGLFSNVVHLGADPALIGFINRPKEAAPHTIANIERGKVYTMNLVTAQIAANAHQASAKYDTDVDEFEAVQLTTETIQNINAPFVKESPIKYAMELVEIVPIQHNNTFLVIGQITDVLLTDHIIQEDGFLNMENEGIITSLGIDAYFTTNAVARYEYAKPDKWAAKL